MKKIILLFTTLLFVSAYAQENIYTNVNWSAYMQQLEYKIKSNWTPPITDKSIKTVIRFTVGKNGDLLNIKLIQSSGIPLGDKIAMNAIKKALPCPLPNEYKGNSIPIDFTFDYNIVSDFKKITLRSIYQPENSNNAFKDINIEKTSDNFATKNHQDLNFYTKEIKKIIESNWVPPKEHESDYMVFHFKVKKDGSLKDLKMTHTSCFLESNKAAIYSIENSAPFKPFPVNIDWDEISIEYIFGYQESTCNNVHNPEYVINNQKPDILLWLKEKSKKSSD